MDTIEELKDIRTLVQLSFACLHDSKSAQAVEDSLWDANARLTELIETLQAEAKEAPALAIQLARDSMMSPEQAMRMLQAEEDNDALFGPRQ